MKLLSVIIPVYNVERYLERCINSVLNQSYSNLEIIAINDGSTDSSWIILQKYSKLSNFIVINQKNQGQSCARNMGLDIAKGEYIAFLDSDDYVSPNMYDSLVSLLEQYGTDMAACASIDEDIHGNPINQTEFSGKISILSSVDLLGDLYCNKNARSEVWNKIFRREIIGDIRFKINQKFEEVYFDRIFFQRANGCVFIDKPYHHYLLSRDGNTNSSFNYQKFCIFSELEDIIKDMRSVNQITIVSKIQAMQLFFSMLLGIQAYNCDADKLTRKKIMNLFTNYKKINRNNEYAKKLRLRTFLFSISPILLSIALKMYKGNDNL